MNRERAILVKIKTSVVTVKGLPFEVAINTEIDIPVTGFDSCWTVRLTSTENDKSEMPVAGEKQKLEAITHTIREGYTSTVWMITRTDL